MRRHRRYRAAVAEKREEHHLVWCGVHVVGLCGAFQHRFCHACAVSLHHYGHEVGLHAVLRPAPLQICEFVQERHVPRQQDGPCPVLERGRIHVSGHENNRARGGVAHGEATGE